MSNTNIPTTTRKMSFTNEAAQRFASQVNKKLNEARQTPTVSDQAAEKINDASIIKMQRVEESNNNINPKLSADHSNGDDEEEEILNITPDKETIEYEKQDSSSP